jgi:hypothetical protein
MPKMLRGFPLDSHNPLEIEEALEMCLSKFYKKHILPFAAHENLDFSLILAAQSGLKYSLWATCKTSVHKCVLYGAVGAGSMYANVLLKRLCGRADIDLETAQIIAAYVVFRVKGTIEGCGKETDIATVQNGSLGIWRRQTVSI